MFGEKAARIKELEKDNEKLRDQNMRLIREKDSIMFENEELKEKNERLTEELKKIKPVIETSGFKPAVTDKCDQCRYAYYSDYDGELIGCCKDVVCKDFESTVEEKAHA